MSAEANCKALFKTKNVEMNDIYTKNAQVLRLSMDRSPLFYLPYIQLLVGSHVIYVYSPGTKMNVPFGKERGSSTTLGVCSLPL